MKAWRVDLKGQGGYTLVEVIISAAIGAMLLAAVSSVVLTSWRGATIASSRVEASGQIRNFEYFAYDDFARSAAPSAGGCPCTTQPLVLTGLRAGNPTPVTVTYTWDGSNFLDRTDSSTGATEHAAIDVTAFSWYVDTNATVVVSLTITLQGPPVYSESQVFRFYPRMKP